jgi:uncharacterized protein YbjT (DUF2867 family)
LSGCCFYFAKQLLIIGGYTYDYCHWWYWCHRSELLRLLSQAGISARALSRDPNKGQKLPHITWVIGDLSQPETLTKAFEGAKSLFLLTHYYEDMVELQHNAIVAAKAAGVTM